jgi:SAM-dependent methyltransferase
MRVAYKYVRAEGEADGSRVTRDEAPAHFAATVGLRSYAGREEFLASAASGHHGEILVGLRRLLARDCSILSVASGNGVIEAVLRLEGFDVVASDFAPELLAGARRLVPELPTLELDVLRPEHRERYDDVLAIGLDYALDDSELATFLGGARGLLRPGGRLILAHTYRDTLVTKLIDEVLLPLWARPRLAGRRQGEPRWVRKEHGFRRTERELIGAAEAEGFVRGRGIRYGWALELTRLGVDVRLPRVYRTLVAVCAALRIFNYGTLLELTLRS